MNHGNKKLLISVDTLDRATEQLPTPDKDPRPQYYGRREGLLNPEPLGRIRIQPAKKQPQIAKIKLHIESVAQQKSSERLRLHNNAHGNGLC